MILQQMEISFWIYIGMGKMTAESCRRRDNVKIKVAQLQLKVFEEKEKNIEQLHQVLEKLRKEKVDLVTVGEMFTCPYRTENFPVYAEKEGGDSWQAFSAFAKEYHVYLSVGSIAEMDENGRVYNTAYVFNRDGRQIAKHRKVHLFDIEIEGGQCFKESDTLTAGDRCTVFDTEFGKMGICICFDCRFPELSRLMVQQGAKVILVPAAFNMTTGPAHWEIMFRQRAVDNQCYMIGTSDARTPDADYVAWGHSMIVSPWGNIIQEMDEKPGYRISEIDLDYVDKVRRELPLLKARRVDLYSLECLK